MATSPPGGALNSLSYRKAKQAIFNASRSPPVLKFLRRSFLAWPAERDGRQSEESRNLSGRERERKKRSPTHIQTEAETAKPRLEAAITAGEARWELRRLATDAARNRKPDSGYSVAGSLLRFEYGNRLTARPPTHPLFSDSHLGCGCASVSPLRA